MTSPAPTNKELAIAARAASIDLRILDAPCIFCGYNGAGYWQRGTHAAGCLFQNVGGDVTRADILRDEATAARLSESTCQHEPIRAPQVSDGWVCHKCGKRCCGYPQCKCPEPWDCQHEGALGKSAAHVKVADPETAAAADRAASPPTPSEAREVAVKLHHLFNAKRLYPTIHGQMVGAECYTLRADGFAFEALMEAAAMIEQQASTIERFKELSAEQTATYREQCETIERLEREKALIHQRMSFEAEQHAEKCVALADAESTVSRQAVEIERLRKAIAEVDYIEEVNNNGPDTKICPFCLARQEGTGNLFGTPTWKPKAPMAHAPACVKAAIDAALKGERT